MSGGGGGIPAVSIMGWSGSGKTTFLTKLLPELKARGLRCAVVKHDGHEFEIDRPGKDSWRFAQAGAEVVAISSKSKAALMIYRETALSELLEGIRDVDLILIEGWKHTDLPRVEVRRAANGKPPVESSEKLLALVTDLEGETGCPVFSPEDSGAFADFLLACLADGRL